MKVKKALLNVRVPLGWVARASQTTQLGPLLIVGLDGEQTVQQDLAKTRKSKELRDGGCLVEACKPKHLLLIH